MLRPGRTHWIPTSLEEREVGLQEISVFLLSNKGQSRRVLLFNPRENVLTLFFTCMKTKQNQTTSREMVWGGRAFFLIYRILLGSQENLHLEVHLPPGLSACPGSAGVPCWWSKGVDFLTSSLPFRNFLGMV